MKLYIFLEHRFLYGNELTGEIPEEIGGLTNLKHLYLYDNGLTGQLPSSIGGLSSLTHLFLYGNALSGSIPGELGELSNLEKLFLYDNQLTGELPNEINDLAHLEYLYINNNNLTGIIDSSICTLNLDWSNSLYFNISNNQFCLPFPSCLEDYMGYQDTTYCGSILTSHAQEPTSYKVYDTFPNPFNPSTTLNYFLPKSIMLKIVIYDIHGRVINNLYDGYQEAGNKSVTWPAKNDAGRPVSAGLYFLILEAEDFRDTKKMVFLK